jgi:hypothetical protein
LGMRFSCGGRYIHIFQLAHWAPENPRAKFDVHIHKRRAFQVFIGQLASHIITRAVVTAPFAWSPVQPTASLYLRQTWKVFTYYIILTLRYLAHIKVLLLCSWRQVIVGNCVVLRCSDAGRAALVSSPK